MFDKMLNLVLVLILACVVGQVVSYTGPVPVVYDNTVIRAQGGRLVACPTVQEQQEAHKHH